MPKKPSPPQTVAELSGSQVASPTILIVLGVSGDLMARKIGPALHRLFKKGYCPSNFKVVGYARRNWSDGYLQKHIRQNLKKYGHIKTKKSFLNLFTYHQGNFEHKTSYKELNKKLKAIDKDMGVCTNKLFYLAVPPKHYRTIFTNLAESGLMEPCGPNEGYTRIIVEKPFGKDLDHAMALEKQLKKLFDESQIYRIDHYLAKEALQSILSFRFSNNLLGTNWGNQEVERIEVKLLEKLDIEGRGAFYDSVGALVDVGQNHILQMLALVAMRQPEHFQPEAIRSKRAEILTQLGAVKNAKRDTVRGQYSGYRNEDGVDPESNVETYFKIRTSIDDAKWRGVEIYLEGGKALAENDKQIKITFTHPMPCLCPPGGHLKNELYFRIQPNPGIDIKFWNKKPGSKKELEEQWLKFEAPLGESSRYHAEYTQLLLDAMNGDQTSFITSEEALASWRFVDPIIKAWRAGLTPLYTYDKSGPVNNIANNLEQPTVELKKELGVVGLGKMGKNLAINLLERGWQVSGYNRSPLKDIPYSQTQSLQELVAGLKPPRLLWLSLPHEVVEEVVFGKTGLVSLLDKGDYIIDAGNSYYKDSIKRAKRLKKQKINFVDVGVSGGPSGARLGACLMIGGDRAVFNKLAPLFADVATEEGFQFFQGAGAGHFVKMVHNGIEYGMMQSIAEGFHILKKSKLNLDLQKVSDIYNKGSVIESRLVGWLEDAFELHGETLKGVSGKVGHTGEGAWTVEEAKRLRVKAKIIEESLKFRKRSAKNPDFTGKVLSALREQFGGHSITE